jgi:hypothetical protein
MEKQKLDKDEIKKVVTERIRAGDDYKKTRKFLEKSGIEYSGLKTTFYTWKQELFPEDLRGEALSVMKEAKETKKKPLLPTPKAWSKQKQSEADSCVFADAINEALFYFVPCPQHNLKIEDVKQINLGGAITGVIVYYTGLNLSHPVIVLVTRAIVLVLKVRQMCYIVNEKVEEIKKKAREFSMPGVHSP